MSTYVPWFISHFKSFLHACVLAKLATSSIRVTSLGRGRYQGDVSGGRGGGVQLPSNHTRPNGQLTATGVAPSDLYACSVNSDALGSFRTSTFSIMYAYWLQALNIS